MGDKKVVWVDSYKDIPFKVPSTIRGTTNMIEGKVYLIRGKSDKSDEFHERYHLDKGFKDFGTNPTHFIQEELRANLASYKETGKPRRLIKYLRQILASLLEEYSLGPKEALSLIKSISSKERLPEQWRQDVESHSREVNKIID